MLGDWSALGGPAVSSIAKPDESGLRQSVGLSVLQGGFMD